MVSSERWDASTTMANGREECVEGLGGGESDRGKDSSRVFVTRESGRD